jgi:hypothetical protein
LKRSRSVSGPQQDGISELALLSFSDDCVVKLVAETDLESTFGALRVSAGRSRIDVTNATRLIDSQAQTRLANMVLSGQYRNTSVAEGFSDLLLLHFAKPGMLKGDEFTVTVVHIDATDILRDVVYDGQANTGFIISVPAEGEYRVEARESNGVLLEVRENGQITFPVFDGATFIEPLPIVPPSPTIQTSKFSVEVIGAIVMAALILVGVVVGLISLKMGPGIGRHPIEKTDLPAPDDLPDSTAIACEPRQVREEEDVLEDVDAK